MAAFLIGPMTPGAMMSGALSYRWTVEGAGGVVLCAGPFPAVVLKGDDPRPAAFALMGWLADGIGRRAWWDGADYRPYKEQRRRALIGV